jgi:phage shock protein PspC (stress-responsive transcriptional regulator)
MRFGWAELAVIVVLLLVATGTIGARRGAKGKTVPPRRADGSRVLCRLPQHAGIAGVCAGFAYYFSWPIWVARLLFTLSIFAGGAGILVYLLMWIFMPIAESVPDDFDARTT